MSTFTPAHEAPIVGGHAIERDTRALLGQVMGYVALSGRKGSIPDVDQSPVPPTSALSASFAWATGSWSSAWRR